MIRTRFEVVNGFKCLVCSLLAQPWHGQGTFDRIRDKRVTLKTAISAHYTTL